MGNIDLSWKAWNMSGADDDFCRVLDDAKPIIDNAVMTYAPNSSPAVRSKAKILAAQAIKMYDPSKGTKLQTFLHVQLQPLQREAASYTTVHAPERVRFDLSRLKQMQRRFFDENGRDPNIDELTDFTGLSRKRIAHIRKFDRGVVGEGMFEESGEGGAGMPQVQQAASMWEDFVYDELGPQDKLIYDLKTGRGGEQPLGVSDIARRLKVSAGAISQRLSRIANRLAEGKELESTYGKQF